MKSERQEHTGTLPKFLQMAFVPHGDGKHGSLGSSDGFVGAVM